MISDGNDWTCLVEFLEARIAEKEAASRAGPFAPGTADVAEFGDKACLAQLMRDECAQERAIIAGWKEAADAEEITKLSEAEGTVAISRRSMLTILAGSYRDHPDFDPVWTHELPMDMACEPTQA